MPVLDLHRRSPPAPGIATQPVTQEATGYWEGHCLDIVANYQRGIYQLLLS